jgi:hypothetical protein
MIVSQVLTPTADYIHNTLPGLRERIAFDVKNLDQATNKMIASYRGVLGTGLTWIVNFENYGDTASVRNLHQAAYKVGGAKLMLDTYLSATGQELPASLKQEYGDFEGLYEAACDQISQKDKAVAA